MNKAYFVGPLFSYTSMEQDGCYSPASVNELSKLQLLKIRHLVNKRKYICSTRGLADGWVKNHVRDDDRLPQKDRDGQICWRRWCRPIIEVSIRSRGHRGWNIIKIDSVGISTLRGKLSIPLTRWNGGPIASMETLVERLKELDLGGFRWTMVSRWYKESVSEDPKCGGPLPPFNK